MNASHQIQQNGSRLDESTPHFVPAFHRGAKGDDMSAATSAVVSSDAPGHGQSSMNPADQVMESDREEGELSDGPQVDTRGDKDASQDDERARKAAKKEKKRQKKLAKLKLLEEAAAAAAEKEQRKQAKQERRLKKKQMREQQVSEAQADGQTQQSSSSKLETIIESVQIPLPVDLTAERRKAKDFIKQWALNGFTFQQLLGEGLDAHFLKNIYQELNLETTNTTKSTQSVEKQQSIAQANAPDAPLAVLEPKTTLAHQEKTADSSSAVITPSYHVDVNHAFATLPLVHPIPAKPPQPLPVHSQAAAINRKEYIARLLAARARNAAVPDTTISSTAGEIAVSPVAGLQNTDDVPLPRASETLVARNADSEVASSSSTNEVQKAPQIQPSNTNLEELTLAAKRKAQTELARLRLQALASAKAANGTKSDPPRDASTTQAPVIDLTARGPGRRTFSRPASMPVIEVMESGSEDGELLEDSNPAHPPEVQVPQSTDLESVNVSTDVSASKSSDMPMSVARPAMSLNLAESEPLSSLPHTLLPLLSGQTTPKDHARKRPVASDFDDDRPPTKLAKRPFGEAPGVVGYQDIVIEVSDDDSEIDHVQRPSLHRLQSRGAVNDNVSSITSNEEAADAASAAEAERLRLREEQISEMKKRIVELELKRRAKAALASRPGTPANIQQPDQSSPAMTPASGTKFAKSVNDDDEIAPQNLVVSNQHSADSQGLPTTPKPATIVHNGIKSALASDVAPSANARSSTTEDTVVLDKHIKRREEIRTRLPLITANFANTQSKMALLKAQMEALQAEMLQEQTEKEKLVQELEEYGVDTEGMPRAQLQAVKDSIVAHEAAGEDTGNAVEQQADINKQQRIVDTQEEDVPGQGAVSELNAIGHVTFPESTRHNGLLDATEPHVIIDVVNGINPTRDIELTSIVPSGPSNVSAGSEASDNMSLDDDDSVSGEILSSLNGSPSARPDKTVSGQSATAPSVDTRPTSADVHVDAGSTTQITPNHLTMPITADTTSTLVADDLEMDTDSESDYEPPDARPVVPTERPLARAQQQLPPSPLQVQHTNDLPSSTQEPRSTASTVESTVRLCTKPLCLLTFPQATIVQSIRSVFKPYVSPLTNFKAYRYAPQFAKEVPGGLRSTTYSHAINEQKPLCQYETLGGICNDPQCEDQHWRQMVAGGMYWF